MSWNYELGRTDYEGDCFYVIDESGAICLVMHQINSDRTAYDREKEEANARLIAAAPELLEALSEMLVFHDKGKQPPLRLLESARAAISKAKAGA